MTGDMLRLMLASHHDLLLTLYETVHRPDSWRTFLDQVCAGINVRSAVVQRLRTGGPTLQTTWLAFDSYSEEYAAQHAPVVNDVMNPRLQAEYDLPPLAIGQVGIACDEDLPMPAHVRRRFQDDLGDVGLGKGIFAGMDIAPTEGFSLILHRHPGEKTGYSSRDRAFLMDLVPHLSQAIVLSDKLNRTVRQSAAMQQVLDRARPALIICDPQARLIWSNQAAQQVLKSSDSLKVIAGRVSCKRHDRTAALHALIRRTCLQGEDETLDQRCLVVDDHGFNPMHVMVMPLPKTEDDGEDQVALFLTQTGAAFDIPARLLEKLFRLSPAEARLAKAIVEGGAVNTYALAQGLAEGTVRFQLKQVLAKTGCPRQSDLVRLVCSTMMSQFGH